MKINLIDLITSKIFHDIGNTISAFNLYLEMVQDNLERLSEASVAEINANINSTYKVLKFAFCRTDYNPEIFNNLREYLINKGKEFTFTNLHLVSFSDYLLQVLINAVLLISSVIVTDCVIKVTLEEDKLFIIATGSRMRDEYIPITLNPQNFQSENVHAYFITAITTKENISYHTEYLDNTIKISFDNIQNNNQSCTLGA